MNNYNPHSQPDPEEWQELDEQEQIVLISEYHEREQIDLPGGSVHAAFHAAVENQLAEGMPDVREALSRLMEEGLDRHEAVHAVGSVLAECAWSALQPEGAAAGLNEEYLERVRALSAEEWKKT